MNISEKEFDTLVKQTTRSVINALPPNLRIQAETILIVTQGNPVHTGGNDDRSTLGIYEGVPLTERHITDTILPDKITIFRIPHLDECHSRTELKRELRITLLHELGHFFGFDEEQIHVLGLD